MSFPGSNAEKLAFHRQKAGSTVYTRSDAPLPRSPSSSASSCSCRRSARMCSAASCGASCRPASSTIISPARPSPACRSRMRAVRIAALRCFGRRSSNPIPSSRRSSRRSASRRRGCVGWRRPTISTTPGQRAITRRRGCSACPAGPTSRLPSTRASAAARTSCTSTSTAFAPGLRDALAREAAAIGASRWTSVKVLPNSPRYWARGVPGETLAGTNVFDLVADGLHVSPDDMHEITIVVVGSDDIAGKPGFVVLARKRQTNIWDEGHGEGADGSFVSGVSVGAIADPDAAYRLARSLLSPLPHYASPDILLMLRPTTKGGGPMIETTLHVSIRPVVASSSGGFVTLNRSAASPACFCRRRSRTGRRQTTILPDVEPRRPESAIAASVAAVTHRVGARGLWARRLPAARPPHDLGDAVRVAAFSLP